VMWRFDSRYGLDDCDVKSAPPLRARRRSFGPGVRHLEATIELIIAEKA